MNSLAGTLARLGQDAITILRAAADTYAGGVRTAGTRSPISTTGSIQPAKPSDIQRLPEGVRSRETVAVFAPVPLRQADDRAGTVADRVQRADGRIYEVADVDEWNATAGYCKAICSRVEG